MKTPGGGGYGILDTTSGLTNKSLAASSIQFVERGSVFDYRQSQESV